MTNKNNKSGKGKNVFARKPHGVFYVKERVKIDQEYVELVYSVQDFTSRSL